MDYYLVEKEGQGLQFSHLIRNVLQDTQQRLVFRVQTFIRNEIQNFVPQPSDLDYPNKLKELKGNDKRNYVLQYII